MFYVNMVNTKVVDNFLNLLILKFHDFRHAGLGVIDFRSLLSGFACPLNRSEWLYCLAYLNMESCIDDNNKVIDNLISFPESLGSPLFDAYSSSYGWKRDCCAAAQILCMHLSWLPILDVACACSKLCGPS
jgi:hypothetical protein